MNATITGRVHLAQNELIFCKAANNQGHDAKSQRWPKIMAHTPKTWYSQWLWFSCSPSNHIRSTEWSTVYGLYCCQKLCHQQILSDIFCLYACMHCSSSAIQLLSPKFATEKELLLMYILHINMKHHHWYLSSDGIQTKALYEWNNISAMHKEQQWNNIVAYKHHHLISIWQRQQKYKQYRHVTK